MDLRPVRLLDRSSVPLGAIEVADVGKTYRGTVSLESAPPSVRELFAEFEACVEGQMFGLADELEHRIAALGCRVAFADGTAAPVEDLQVYPSTGRISFKVDNKAVSGSRNGNPGETVHRPGIFRS